MYRRIECCEVCQPIGSFLSHSCWHIAFSYTMSWWPVNHSNVTMTEWSGLITVLNTVFSFLIKHKCRRKSPSSSVAVLEWCLLQQFNWIWLRTINNSIFIYICIQQYYPLIIIYSNTHLHCCCDLHILQKTRAFSQAKGWNRKAKITFRTLRQMMQPFPLSNIALDPHLPTSVSQSHIKWFEY